MSIMRFKRLLTYGGAIACGGGGKSGGGTTVVPATPPPPPPPEEEAMMTEFTDEEADKLQRKAIIQGAKSLQIPLGSTGTSTVGTA